MLSDAIFSVLFVGISVSLSANSKDAVVGYSLSGVGEGVGVFLEPKPKNPSIRGFFFYQHINRVVLKERFLKYFVEHEWGQLRLQRRYC